MRRRYAPSARPSTPSTKVPRVPWRGVRWYWNLPLRGTILCFAKYYTGVKFLARVAFTRCNDHCCYDHCDYDICCAAQCSTRGNSRYHEYPYHIYEEFRTKDLVGGIIEVLTTIFVVTIIVKTRVGRWREIQYFAT